MMVMKICAFKKENQAMCTSRDKKKDQLDINVEIKDTLFQVTHIKEI